MIAKHFLPIPKQTVRSSFGNTRMVCFWAALFLCACPLLDNGGY